MTIQTSHRELGKELLHTCYDSPCKLEDVIQALMEALGTVIIRVARNKGEADRMAEKIARTMCEGVRARCFRNDEHWMH
jgi:hypothetical protein